MRIEKFSARMREKSRIIDLFQILGYQDRLKDLPGKWGKFYKYQPFQGIFMPKSPLWNMHECHREMYGVYNLDSKDFYNTGLTHECSNPCCPVCSWKKAARKYSQLKYLIQPYLDQDKYKIYLLTLTVPSNLFGFKDDLKNLRKFENVIFNCFGGREVVLGWFSSFELTWSDSYGWHPHLHCLFILPKDRIGHYDFDKCGSLKYLDVMVNHKFRDCSQYALESKILDYNAKMRLYPGASYIHIKLEETYSGIDNTLNELCKYICKTDTIKDEDQLFMFVRDMYGQYRYKMLGCLSISKKKEAYYAFMAEREQKEYDSITQNINSIQLHLLYDGNRRAFWYTYNDPNGEIRHQDIIFDKGFIFRSAWINERKDE